MGPAANAVIGLTRQPGCDPFSDSGETEPREQTGRFLHLGIKQINWVLPKASTAPLKALKTKQVVFCTHTSQRRNFVSSSSCNMSLANRGFLIFSDQQSGPLQNSDFAIDCIPQQCSDTNLL
ncbi:hypothetical protein MRB53_005733 [Persea americana]|uniref:Uncharacterized protein n=1 Tax=Persea americana TaxID=3435 RepID=A0ACC2MEW2_PERAE|nr:hypothetical protein MRB53_005733 [Persea americana]